jgi:ABC-2 type transport system ATP-binding protein
MTQIAQPSPTAAPSFRRSPAIEVSGLVRTFQSGQKTIRAVDGVDLQVESGTIYALLGPNGAGKTTTISILTTLIPPTTGLARVAGNDVVKDAAQVRRIIGATFQETVVDKNLSGRDALDTHGRLYHLPRNLIKSRIEELTRLVELEDAIDRPTKTYSGGMKRRLELARGLMTAPQVLFLDEPTQGLDPQNRDRIWTYIRQLRAEQGLTILLTTHYMEEAEQLADRVGIIDAGRIVQTGTPAELIGALGEDVVTILGDGNTANFLETLRQQPYVDWASQYASAAVEGADESEAAPEIPAATVQIGLREQAGKFLRPIVELAEGAGFKIADFSIKRPSLNDVFLKYTGRRLRD